MIGRSSPTTLRSRNKFAILIQELQIFAADFQSYDRSDILPVIAIYLLAEWEVAESFETVLDCFALDDKYGGYELGDLITEDGPVILAALCRADLDALERFTERKDISGWARAAAFKAMVALVLWDKVPRDDVVNRFAWLFRRKPFARGDGITWTQFVDAAFELYPAELMDEIRPLFRQGIVDPFATTLEEFEREAKRDRATTTRLSRAARKALAGSSAAYIASISFWEVAMLEAKGRIQLPTYSPARMVQIGVSLQPDQGTPVEPGDCNRIHTPARNIPSRSGRPYDSSDGPSAQPHNHHLRRENPELPAYIGAGC